jgi:hypothetical protein
MFEISPTFLLSLVIALLAGVGWLLRLEAKVSTAARDVGDLSKDFYDHDKNLNVHHDGAELDRRFNVIDEGMRTIQKGIDKVNDRLDRLFTKQ